DETPYERPARVLEGQRGHNSGRGIPPRTGSNVQKRSVTATNWARNLLRIVVQRLFRSSQRRGLARVRGPASPRVIVSSSFGFCHHSSPTFSPSYFATFPANSFTFRKSSFPVPSSGSSSTL